MANPNNNNMDRYVDAAFFAGEWPEINELFNSMSTNGLPDDVKRWMFSGKKNDKLKDARPSNILQVVSPRSIENVAMARLSTPPSTPSQPGSSSKSPKESNYQQKTPPSTNYRAKCSSDLCATVATTPMSWTPPLRQTPSTLYLAESTAVPANNRTLSLNPLLRQTGINQASPLPSTSSTVRQANSEILPTRQQLQLDVYRFLQNFQQHSQCDSGHVTPTQLSSTASQSNTNWPIGKQTYSPLSSISTFTSPTPSNASTFSGDLEQAYILEQAENQKRGFDYDENSINKIRDEFKIHGTTYDFDEKLQTWIPAIEESSNYCVFCFNNKEPVHVIQSHNVKDASGKVQCPRLRKYKCPNCGVSGDKAHTLKYCPQKKIYTHEDVERLENNKKIGLNQRK